jgi:DNA-binding transcriptional ArsR family regulator
MEKQSLELDERCARILSIITLRGELRFNELHELSRRTPKIRMPKATLEVHLNHLVEKGLVLKNRVSHKNVTYRLNKEKLGSFEGFLKETPAFIKGQKQIKKNFLDLPVDVQVDNVLRLLVGLGFEALKFRVLSAKYKQFRHRLMVQLYEDYNFRFLEHLMVDRCVEDAKYQRKVFAEINGLLERLGWNYAEVFGMSD